MDPTKLRELLDKRNAAAAEITRLAELIYREHREFTAEEQAKWDKANKDFDQAKREHEAAVRADEVRREQERRVGDRDVGREHHDGRERRRDNVQPTEEQRTLCFRAWAKAQYGRPLTRDERRACRALRFDPRSGELRIPVWSDQHTRDVQHRLRATQGERRADVMRKETRANMSAYIPTTSYLVPPASLSNALEVNMLAFGGVLQVADILTTSSGEPLLMPTADDTGNRAALLAENSQAFSAGVNPSFGIKMWNAYKFTSQPILVPTELLEDSAFDLPSMVGEMLGIRLGRGIAPYLATGTGGNQPEGIVTGASLGVTAASATAIKFDELVDLIHSIDPAYRSQPGVGFLMHDLIKAYIRKIKDGNGRPLWLSGEYYADGIRTGEPDSLLGYQINICQELDSTVTTTKKTILFGVLDHYKVRRVNDVRLYRLQERFRDLDQDGFVAFERLDGKLLSAGTQVVKYLQQA